ncbi:MAG: transposase [Planctomycetes bacterium]|nr:transposase [Planctomycetota bacterium]MBM4093963.1 transposase [Planctomycetota bacterium]
MGKYHLIPGYAGPYLITWTVVAWQPVFIRPQYFDVLVKSFEFCRAHKGLGLHAFVIMPTHGHMIASGPEEDRLAGLIRDMKRHTSKQIHQMLIEDGRQDLLAVCRTQARPGQDFALWQPEHHPKLLVGEEMALQKVRYIHGNPVRAGFVDEPEHWLYSSARNYADRPDCVTQVDLLF